MKKHDELVVAVSLVPLDFLLTFLAAVTAYNLRFGWLAGLRPVTFDLPYAEYLGLAAAAALLSNAFLALSGLYRIGGPRRLTFELTRVFLASSTTFLAFIVFIFFRRELFSSRFIILAAWILTVVYLSLGRIAVRLTQRRLLRYGIGVRRAALIGNDEHNTQALMAAFASDRELGYRVVAAFSVFDSAAETELSRLNQAGALDEIIVTDPTVSRADLSRILGFAQSRQIGFRYSADLLETHAMNVRVGTLAGRPMVEVRGTRLDGWGRVFKRLFDIIGSILLIVVTSPIMLVTAIAVKMDSSGPVFFELDDGSPPMRVGEKGRRFRFLKFRSMYPRTHQQRYDQLTARNERADGPLIKIKDDPRVTRVGRFIRHYSIDEMPQFFLALKGDMSLVGPRPHEPEEVAKYEEKHRRVFSVKPGITGLAQISGRADLTFEEEVRLDTYYVENWSPWLDLTILLKTPFVVLSRKGAS
ncbi:MAG: sugar transferase [Patescibacteria group bacterium]|nr:sugar transferase [Patescibacteria group bacterium]